MTRWRERAIAACPELRDHLADRRTTIYLAFFELLPRCREAHLARDDDTLARIYGFAEWCMERKEKRLWNAAGVAFYEHLADRDFTVEEMPRWVKPSVFAQVAGLLERRMERRAFARLARRYAALGEH